MTETIELPCPVCVDPTDGERCEAAIVLTLDVERGDLPGDLPRVYAVECPPTCPEGHPVTDAQRKRLGQAATCYFLGAVEDEHLRGKRHAV